MEEDTAENGHLMSRGSFSASRANTRATRSDVAKGVLVTNSSFRIVDIEGTSMDIDISQEKGMPLGALFLDFAI